MRYPALCPVIATNTVTKILIANWPSALHISQKTQDLSHSLNELGKQNQSDVLKTEDFLSFLCMRNENEQLPGLLRHFKARGAVTRASSQYRKRKLADQKKKKQSVAKKLLFYKQIDM